MSAVHLSYSSIRLPDGSLDSEGLVAAIELSAKNNEQEIMIENIVPEVEVGRDDLAIVPVVYDDIINRIRNLFQLLGREMPEHRLNLRRGQFDIRLHVGNARSTDFGDRYLH